MRRPASASPSSTPSPRPAGPGLIGGVIVGVMTGKAIAAGPRQAVHRRQSPGGPRADRAADRRRRLSLSAAAGLRRPLPAAGRRGCRAAIAASAPPSTTRPARPSTRSRSCWAWAYPGGPAVERAARGGDGKPVRPAAADDGPRGLRFLLLRLEDGAAPPGADWQRCRPLDDQDRADLAAGAPGRHRRQPRRPHAQRHRASPRAASGDRCAGRGRRRRREQARARGRWKSLLRGNRPALRRAAAAPLHRQRRDDRLGRRRAVPQWAEPTRFDFAPRPRWPLDATAPKAIGAGVKA